MSNKIFTVTVAIAGTLTIAMYLSLSAMGAQLCDQPNVFCRGELQVEDAYTPGELQVTVDDGTGIQLDTLNPQKTLVNVVGQYGNN